MVHPSISAGFVKTSLAASPSPARSRRARSLQVRFAPDSERIGDATEGPVGPKPVVRCNAVILPMSKEKPTSRAYRECVEFDPTRKSGMHRNNQDNDGLQLVFGPSPASIAGGAGTRPEQSIGGHGAQFRFYLPAKCPDGADGT